MKVLVFGGSGRVGCDLLERFLVTDDVWHPGSKSVDITNPAHVRDAVDSFHPDVVVNLAAYTDVDGAASEDGMQRARQINAVGPANIAHVLPPQSFMIQISTDFVFSGTAADGYVEQDIPDPVNFYGLSKWHGERFCRDQGIVLRTSWVMGAHKASFVDTVLRRMMSMTGTMKVVSDQEGSPTRSMDLAAAIDRLVHYDRAPYSILHFAGTGCCSRFELAREAARCALKLTGMGCFDPERLAPCLTSDLPAQAAIRPRRSPLKMGPDSMAVFAPLARPWQAMVQDHVSDLHIAGFFGGKA